MTQFLPNPTQAYQILVSKKKNSIFGEFFKLMFVLLHNILLNTNGDEFFKFECMDM